MLTEHDTWTCRNCHPSTIGCLIGGMIFNEGKVSKKKCLILRATFLGRFLFRWFFMIFSGKLMNINGGWLYLYIYVLHILRGLGWVIRRNWPFWLISIRKLFEKHRLVCSLRSVTFAALFYEKNLVILVTTIKLWCTGVMLPYSNQWVHGKGKVYWKFINPWIIERRFTFHFHVIRIGAFGGRVL